MATHLFAIPFRHATNPDFALSTAIRPYIDAKYNQHPDMFQSDLDAIDRLRYEAVHVREAHDSGITKLQAYAAQLVAIGIKFPVDIGAEFGWCPALGRDAGPVGAGGCPVARNNVRWELANILLNLAALHTHLADGCPRATADGLRVAANHLALAAGVLQHVRREVLPTMRMSDPPEDMDPPVLDCLTTICLAQAQECFWNRAVMDNYGDVAICRLAAQVSDLFGDAADAAAGLAGGIISGPWTRVMAAKHQHFAAAAQYRMARECLDKTRFGEEIARLQDAIACADGGLREMKGVGSGAGAGAGATAAIVKVIVDDLAGLKRRAEQDLKRAERDNNLIYLTPIPTKSELARLPRSCMAKTRVPDEVAAPLEHLGEDATFGPALFAQLVPYAVHRAVVIYEDRRDLLVNRDLIADFQALDAKMREFLAALGLPGSLQALEKPLGLPHNVVQHAEELRQADWLAGIEGAIRDVKQLRADNVAQFQDGIGLMTAEAEEDDRLRTRFGTDRWTRPRACDDDAGGSDGDLSRARALHQKAAEIEGLLDSAAHSDDKIRERFESQRELLTLLAGPTRALMDYVPSSRVVGLPETVRAAMNPLRRIYNDLLRLESRRRRRIEAVEELRARDDVRPDIAREAARLERIRPDMEIQPAHFEDFFSRRLDGTYDPELEALERDAAEQERLLAEIERANREFEAQRKRAMAANPERDAALQRLDAAFGIYRALRHDLGTARIFYNDLLHVTGSGYLVPVRAWVEKRRADARALESEINFQLLSLSGQQQSTAAPLTSLSQQPQHLSRQDQGAQSQLQQVQPQPHPRQQQQTQQWHPTQHKQPAQLQQAQSQPPPPQQQQQQQAQWHPTRQDQPAQLPQLQQIQSPPPPQQLRPWHPTQQDQPIQQTQSQPPTPLQQQQYPYQQQEQFPRQQQWHSARQGQPAHQQQQHPQHTQHHQQPPPQQQPQHPQQPPPPPPPQQQQQPQHHPQPPPQQQQHQQHQYHNLPPTTMPAPQTSAETLSQSWVPPPSQPPSSQPQSQPQPRPQQQPRLGPWAPDMGIRFAQGQGQGQAAGESASGTWDPSAGIRFG